MPSRTRLEFTARTSLASRSGASDRMWPTIRLHTVRTRRSQAAGTITSSSVRLRTVIHAHRKGFTPVAFLHIPFLNLLPWYLADPPSFAHPLTRVALLHSFLPSFTLSRPPSPFFAHRHHPSPFFAFRSTHTQQTTRSTTRPTSARTRARSTSGGAGASEGTWCDTISSIPCARRRNWPRPRAPKTRSISM